MKENRRIIDNCLIYTGLAFVEQTNKPELVKWQARITKGDGSTRC